MCKLDKLTATLQENGGKYVSLGITHLTGLLLSPELDLGDRNRPTTVSDKDAWEKPSGMARKTSTCIVTLIM